MYKTLLVLLFASAAGMAAAQAPARADRIESPKPAAAVTYESAFKGYRPYVDPELARWREANDEMGRLNGHVGHLPAPAGPGGAPATAKPPADAGHGGAK